MTITILNDLSPEPTENFLINLQQTLSTGIVSESALVTITDDDVTPVVIQTESPSYTVAEEGGFLMVCLEVSSGDITQPIPVTVSTTGGSATSKYSYMHMQSL